MITYAGETDKMRFAGFFSRTASYLIISESLMQSWPKFQRKRNEIEYYSITTMLDKAPIFVPGNGNIIKNAVTYVSFIKITVIIPKIVLVAQTNFP